MSDTVLKVENLSKVYRLGEVGTGTISHDLNRWWARIRGKEDPFSTVGTVNDRTQKAQKGEYVKALSDINFEVKKGEVLGIIGKNGAGKSTLLKVISQITSPTTGSIKAKGRIASLLEVGTGMHPEMTGRENVYLNGTILGMTKREIDSKFDEIMDFAGCAKYADTPVKRYSSGMKVRLGFAVAAFLEPEILIVDEVLAVGDAEFQKKAVNKMQDISSGGGRTVLFVSHNMRSVKGLCNRTIMLEAGMKKKDGDTSEVISIYLNSGIDLDQLNNRQGIKKYLEKIKHENEFELKEVYFEQNGREIELIAQNGDNINICILFKTHCLIHNFRLFFDIYDEDENLVIRSFYQELELAGVSIKSGEYKFSALIPENFLVAGSYFVKVHAGIIEKKKFEPTDGLKLPLIIEETGIYSRIKMKREHRGVVTYDINWKEIN